MKIKILNAIDKLCSIMAAHPVTNATTLDNLYSNATLLERAATFLATPHLAQPDEDIAQGVPYLYVGQGEAAYSFPRQHPLALVSDDATTCCIIILASASCFCLAHVDSPSQVQFLFAHWEASATHDPTATTVSVVGGYQDEDQTGHGIVTAILHAMQSTATCHYSVELWVNGVLNTIPPSEHAAHSLPRARGALCVPTADGLKVSAMDFASGTYRGPLFNQRMACVSASPLHVLKTDAPLEISLGPYTRSWLRLGAADIARYKWWIDQAPDTLFLRHWSTSPFAEGPKFVDDIKARFQVAIDLVGRESVVQLTQRYRYDPATKAWTIVV
ncbi:Aste57867_23194 [Aphanomyces stellatus]|uniref:Aste57867_23194 protein n=1 Tax=Aphanomyces stellatus TaxID=120398 RepID=A0A485LN57_9STRA|nr:hypothetical protein As57867_023123 [Aphanomyces stellatus]VFT99841.1 Aste57867_23194 [Aphanomyces stellatus]